MEINLLPTKLRDEVKIHISDGYELESFEDGILTMFKKKPIRIGMLLINILTFRWLVYMWLPNILVSDLFRVKYYLYIREEGDEIAIATG